MNLITATASACTSKSSVWMRVLLFAVLGWCCVSALAQSSRPSGVADTPCLSRQPVPPELKSLREELLKPGNKLSPQELETAFKQPAIQAFAKSMREQRERDWPDLCRYKADNAALQGKRPRVVFMGDSITENWVLADPALFADGMVGRGISGQMSAHMLLRFYADVIALRPRVVHIMAGTNDLASGTGPDVVQDYKNNMLAMLDLAQMNNIAVVLASIPPASNFLWTKVDARAQIRDINAWLKQTAHDRNLVFVDYGAVLADADGSMKSELGNDGVHPNQAGYQQMKPLAAGAIVRALDRSKRDGT